MNRSKLADISQIVSSAAIVLTLIYLTVEVNQNTDALHAQSRETVLSISQASLFATMQNPDIIQTFVKEDPLSVDEIVKLNAFLVAFMRGREFAWLQFRDGIIDEDQWATELAALKFVMRPHRNREWWQQYGRPNFSAAFVNFADAQFEIDPPTDEHYERLLNWSTCDSC